MKIINESMLGDVKITIYEWNNKYLVKYEAGLFEQTYKVPVLDMAGPEDIKTLALKSEWVEKVFQRFDAMANDWFSELG